MTERTKQDRQIFTFGISMLAIGMALVALLAFNGCSPWANAARATLTARTVGDEIDRWVATKTRAVAAECLSKHKAYTKEYDGCIFTWRAHRDNWRLKARPALSAAVGAAYRSIQLGKLAKEDPKAIWPLAARAVCLASEAGAALGDLMPTSLKGRILGVLKMIEGVSCE